MPMLRRLTLLAILVVNLSLLRAVQDFERLRHFFELDRGRLRIVRVLIGVVLYRKFPAASTP